MPKEIPNEWGHDPLAERISQHVQTMPDRPKLVLAIVCRIERGRDKLVAGGMRGFESACLMIRNMEVYGVPHAVFLFGFERDSNEKAFALLTAMADVPMDEAAIYVDGVARLRLAPVITRRPN